MKKLVFTICAIFLVTGLMAQDDLMIEQIKNAGPAFFPELSASNNVIIGQSGSRNKVNVDQLHSKILPLSNDVVSLQDGIYNEAELIQNGSGNYSLSVQFGSNNKLYLEMRGNMNAAATNQIGSDNSIYELIEGNRNVTEIYQFGSNNSVQTDLIGDGNYPILNDGFPIVQYGNDNHISIKENQPGNMGIMIEQKGSGMELRIENSNIYKK